MGNICSLLGLDGGGYFILYKWIIFFGRRILYKNKLKEIFKLI